jgi:hypothetical protein
MSAENIVAQAARDYLARGWQPVLIHHHSKKPVGNDWQVIQRTPADFSADSNIGLKLGDASHGLTDIDKDCPQAVALAPSFLPPTGFKSGRPGNPFSHDFFICTPMPEHKKFTDVDGTCLLELRSSGQTVMPPSLYENGEQIIWHEANGTPATVTGDILSAAVRELGAATLMVRQYPATGSRHDFSLALAGYLLRQGWAEDRVVRFVLAVAEVAGDGELKDRESAVETTAQRLATGGKAIGGNRLREMMDPAALDKFSDWLGFAPRSSRFTLPIVEADHVAPDEIPTWPLDTLEGDYISDLTYQLSAGTPVPPQFIREQAIAVLSAIADGRMGYPRHPDLQIRRYLAVISERAQGSKWESWKRLTWSNGEGGALIPLLGDLKLLNGSVIGSGQYLAKELEENPHALCHWDESSQLFQVSGQQNSTLFSAMKSLFESNSHWTGSFTNKKHGGDDLHLSVLLHSTRPTFVNGFATRGGIGDGLLSRFTVVYGAGMPVFPEWEPRDLPAERKLVETIGNLIPKKLTVPDIAEDARERMKQFACAIYAPNHPHPDHARRILELTKVDLLHRCIYSSSSEITLEMAETSILWGEHQLASRIAIWPSDARNEVAAMTQCILSRLRKGTASIRDLRTAAHVYRDGSHETFARCLSALKKSGALIVASKNAKNQEVYALEPDDPEKGTSA